MPLRLARTNVETTAGGASGAGAILYDPSRIDQPDASDFDAAHIERDGRLEAATTGGRGRAWFLKARGPGAAAGERWVLRHSRRGGFVAKFVEDAYLWPGEDAVRTFRELRLLAELVELGLPVPAPVAARYVRSGLAYRADLLTVAIPRVRPLSADFGIAPGSWRAIGACLRRFHDAGVFHADLNAHNVLLDEAGRVWLVDFDRGERRPPGAWGAANLARLHRSLAKISGGTAPEAGWRALLDGYGAAQ
jgi:3-deoxy-D-manno-octulosonic acid kinase